MVGWTAECYRLITKFLFAEKKNATVTFWNIVFFLSSFCFVLVGRFGWAKNKKDKESISVELEETDT